MKLDNLLDRLKNKWTETDKQYLIEHYPSDNLKSLSTAINRTVRAIKHQANNLQLRRNKSYSINEQFFNTYSADMAYILGFMITDGCITDNCISFGVALKDKCVLDYIASKLTNGKIVKIYKQKYKETIFDPRSI